MAAKEGKGKKGEAKTAAAAAVAAEERSWQRSVSFSLIFCTTDICRCLNMRRIRVSRDCKTRHKSFLTYFSMQDLKKFQLCYVVVIQTFLKVKAAFFRQ